MSGDAAVTVDTDWMKIIPGPSGFGVWCEHEGGWVAVGPQGQPWGEKEAWWALLERMGSCLHGFKHQVREIPGTDVDDSGDVPCPKCDGDGVCSECERDCVLCDGSGYLSEEAYADWERERALNRKTRDKRRREFAESVTAKP